MAELQNYLNLPSGWEARFDERAGRCYYINHSTRSTTWDDPRVRTNKQYLQSTPKPSPKHFSNIQVEHIPLQHGSPEFRRNYVYPSQPPPIPAFQIPAHISPKSVPFQEMRSAARMSPLTLRGSKVQDSSFTVPVTSTDGEAEAVAKIGAMFPTVSETHIKLLMKKYHSREALVISALQVEKYPITTPGPFATPPPQRNIAVLQHQQQPPLGLRGSRGGSPVTRSAHTGSPRPQSSPKLKLSCRYMKSIFPQADETVILDILQNNDNNIQKTSDALKDMGFNKRDTVKLVQQKAEEKIEEQKKKEEVAKAALTPPLQPKMKTTEEKRQIKQKLQEDYKDVAEHLITIALESVNFDENRANQILKIMIQEDTEAANNKQKTESQAADTEVDAALLQPSCSKSSMPVSQSRQSLKSLLKSEKNEKEINTFSRVIEENGNTYKSKNICSTKGHNPSYAKGPNENLLLEDYIKWYGPNPNLRSGPQNIAKGPNKDLLSKRSYQPCGPNAALRKGPMFGLVKGGVFGQFKAVAVGDGRHE